MSSETTPSGNSRIRLTIANLTALMLHFLDAIQMNTLYYGDNLKILPEYIKDETIDLCYIDPRPATLIRFLRENRNFRLTYMRQIL